MKKMMRILAVAVGPQKDQVIRANGRMVGVRPYVHGLIAGLTDRKHQIGTDFEIDYRERVPEDLVKGPAAASAFKAEPGTQYDLIFAMSTTVLRAAKAVNNSIPIVFPSVSDLKADKISRGGNTTGVSARRSHTAGHCLEYFLATVPTLKEVRVLHKPGYSPGERALKLVKAAAKKRNVKITTIPVQSHREIKSKLSAMPKRDLKKPADVGILVLPIDLCLSAAAMIVDLAQGRKKLPTFFPVTDFVKAKLPSALGGYGVPQRKCGELAAEYVDRILWKNAKAASLKIKEADDDSFEWTVSDSAAKALNIKVPRLI
jgi:ABC-type uncharacterized transport system substrate-binding protein